MTLTGARLRQEFAALGVRRGTVLLVHCSLRRIGRVEGGAAALCEALLDLLGPQGTLVVPAQTRSKSTTSRESRTAVAGLSARQRERYFRRLRGFDARRSRTEDMGALAEFVRLDPRSHRSAHPTTSFAAIGRDAAALTASHPLDQVLGERSPLGWMYRAGASVLLIGVEYAACTAFHLGEHLSVSPDRSYWFKVGTTWRYVPGAREYDDTDFTELGRDFEHAHRQQIAAGRVGEADCRLFPVGSAADFAEKRLPGLRLSSRLMQPEP
ncbi:MAG TPA: AAC(3) family N-acetyltransferase [Actinospica sp.]|jgi:aminoglycoside 3-N-acetyltransferase|nr:AAC(3) family N-acetyltransferase [Actinospica sp.]